MSLLRMSKSKKNDSKIFNSAKDVLSSLESLKSKFKSFIDSNDPQIDSKAIDDTIKKLQTFKKLLK